jgi:hypothetical protein
MEGRRVSRKACVASKFRRSIAAPFRGLLRGELTGPAGGVVVWVIHGAEGK